MKIVTLSLDPKMLDATSVAIQRVQNYGSVVETYTVIVPYQKDEVLTLSPTLTVYGVGGFTKLGKFFRIYRQAAKLIREGKCDVISTDQYYLGLIGYFLASRFHIGFEVQALGFEKFTVLRKHIAQFVFKKAGSIRVNSVRLVDFVQSTFKQPKEKVHMVPIYVHTASMGLSKQLGESDAQLQAQYRAEFTRDFGDRFNFLSVNRLVPIKNISLQIKAIQKLIETHPEVCLHVLGSGPLKDELQEEIESLGLQNHVFLHGHTTGIQLGTYYELCDSFVLTSYSEGWGMVIIEAIAAQLPIIMTDVGCAGEVIIDKESGIVIPINDLESLTKAMIRMIEDDAYRRALQTGASRSLQSLLTLDEILALYVESWEYASKHTL